MRSAKEVAFVRLTHTRQVVIQEQQASNVKQSSIKHSWMFRRFGESSQVVDSSVVVSSSNYYCDYNGQEKFMAKRCECLLKQSEK